MSARVTHRQEMNVAPAPGVTAGSQRAAAQPNQGALWTHPHAQEEPREL